MFPVSHRYESIADAFRFRIAVLSIFVALFALLHSPVHGQDDDARVIQLSRRDDCIRVPVTANGKTYSFVLDSGAAIHAVDPTLVELLGPEVGETSIKTSAVERLRVKVHEFDGATVRGWDVPAAYAASLSMHPIERVTGQRPDGILGAPFLHATTLAYDSATNTLRMSSSPFAEPTAEFWIFSDERGRPYIDGLSFGGARHFTLIDTGHNGHLAVNKPLFDGLVHGGYIIDLAQVEKATLTGEYSARTGLLRECQVGPLALTNVPISESSSNLLGLGLLRMFDFFVDMEHGRLQIRKGQEFSSVIGRPTDRGIRVVTEDGAIVVHGVTKDSAADLAGIRAGDILTHLGDVPVQREKLLEASNLLNGTEAPLKVTVRRGGESFSLIVDEGDCSPTEER